MKPKNTSECPPGDIWSSLCPSRDVLDMVADKWTILIIHALATGVHRHNELARKLGDISQKVLTQCLRKLERSGLVAREVFPVIPPRVEYALTPMGASLVRALETLTKWAEKHYAHVVDARAHFDRTHKK